MSNDLIFYTQIGAIVTYVVSVFGLYKLLVSQKEATIELLKEKVDYLNARLQDAQQQQPDALVESLSKRAKALSEELERLSNDKEANQKKIEETHKKLSNTTSELQRLKYQLERAQHLMEEFFCPQCKAPLMMKETASEMVEYKGRELDVDHEYLQFECGLELVDGEQVSPCKSNY